MGEIKTQKVIQKSSGRQILINASDFTEALYDSIPDDGLRYDGSTFEEFIAAGYRPDFYPPEGYAEKQSEGLDKYRAEIAEAGRLEAEAKEAEEKAAKEKAEAEAAEAAAEKARAEAEAAKVEEPAHEAAPQE